MIRRKYTLLLPFPEKKLVLNLFCVKFMLYSSAIETKGRVYTTAVEFHSRCTAPLSSLKAVVYDGRPEMRSLGISNFLEGNFGGQIGQYLVHQWVVEDGEPMDKLPEGSRTFWTLRHGAQPTCLRHLVQFLVNGYAVISFLACSEDCDDFERGFRFLKSLQTPLTVSSVTHQYYQWSRSPDNSGDVVHDKFPTHDPVKRSRVFRSYTIRFEATVRNERFHLIWQVYSKDTRTKFIAEFQPTTVVYAICPKSPTVTQLLQDAPYHLYSGEDDDLNPEAKSEFDRITFCFHHHFRRDPLQ